MKGSSAHWRGFPTWENCQGNDVGKNFRGEWLLRLSSCFGNQPDNRLSKVDTLNYCKRRVAFTYSALEIARAPSYTLIDSQIRHVQS